MITGFYAGLLAILFVWFSLNVVQLRRKNKVGFGDGGVEALQQAIAAHNNMAQYSPILVLSGINVLWAAYRFLML